MCGSTASSKFMALEVESVTGTPFLSSQFRQRPLLQGCTYACQVVITVSHGVILQHELARQGRVRIERHGRRLIELLVRKLSDRCCCGGAVVSQQFEGLFFRDAIEFLRVCRIHLVNHLTRYPLDGLAFCQRLGQLDLEWIDSRNVMYNHSDFSSVSRNATLPLEFRERSCKSLECKCAQFQSTGKFVTSFTHFFLHQHGLTRC